ncbi:GGDEF domain-containing protein [Xanthobacter autotrophicus DSM 431]|uniref:GGDEF domain-containing protein n=1 Tax=Xanthobacter nonsaccharivorans TaxID=3119912 RepID=UPI003726C3FD
MLDFSSLLLAIFLSATGITAVLLAAWARSRNDGFLLTCAVGAILVALSVVLSAFYAITPQRWLVTCAYVLLLGGLSTIYGTALQFRYDISPKRPVMIAAVLSIGLTIPAFMLGYNGVGFFIGYLAAATLLFLASHGFWRARSEAPGTLTAMAAFYFVICLSFIPRAILVALEGKAVLPGPPRNWAQTTSLALIITGVPALGALTFALNQQRLIRAQRQQALTDPLTGLPNRRALLERVAGIEGQAAIALFDIDRFKSINDTRGHATGDKVIALFGHTLLRQLDRGQIAARLGGEEFVLVWPGGDLDALARQGEEIRREFATLASHQLELTCTVSGGLARGEIAGEAFEHVLATADDALYRAKRHGRDQLQRVD